MFNQDLYTTTYVRDYMVTPPAVVNVEDPMDVVMKNLRRQMPGIFRLFRMINTSVSFPRLKFLIPTEEYCNTSPMSKIFDNYGEI